MRLACLAFLTLVVSVLVCPVSLRGQTPGKASIRVTGNVRGPMNFCGRNSCATYDSGTIKITVNGYAVSAPYSKAADHNTTRSLAALLTGKLNQPASPVTAMLSQTTIQITSKAKGPAANYWLSTSVSRDRRFTFPSFYATPSGNKLSGGSKSSLVPYGTVDDQISNNTSACSAPGDPRGKAHCFGYFHGNKTNVLDLEAQTVRVNSMAKHVSDVNLHAFMDPNWNGSFICEYQPWFGAGNHISVGYNENSPATIAAQASAMLAQGCDIVWVDWYGATSPNQAFNLATANQMFATLKSLTGLPLKFGVLEDKDGLKYSCPVSGKSEAATLNCLIKALTKDMDYIHTHYTQHPVYWTDGGRPVVGSFVTPSQWPVLTKADWVTIWNAVKKHTDAYAGPFKYIFQYGSFTNEAYDEGRYAWVKPSAYNPITQFWWGSNTSPSPEYLDNFYSGARANPSKLAIGAVFKGFDDNNASWSGNRVTAQQCGRVLINSVKETAKYFGGANPQIPYMQVVTWNDYEEGTEVETGIDNCYRINSSVTGGTLRWSLRTTDSNYASTETINHFNIYFGDATGKLYLAGKVPPQSRSFDLSKAVPTGTWTTYVEMVGQPLIINRLSNAQTYISK